MKEESRRRGGRGRASMWLKGSWEDGRREGLASDGQKKKKKKKRRRKRRGREREREKRAHGHRKSGALHSHAKSSDGGVCSHPGDVATKRTPLPSNHCYRQ